MDLDSLSGGQRLIIDLAFDSNILPLPLTMPMGMDVVKTVKVAKALLKKSEDFKFTLLLYRNTQLDGHTHCQLRNMPNIPANMRNDPKKGKIKNVNYITNQYIFPT